MSKTTFSSREFNQEPGGAKKACEKGPVIIPDRGRAAPGPRIFADYEILIGVKQNLTKGLAQKEDGDFDFDRARTGDNISRPVNVNK